jgi:hypothetical protein
MGDCNLYLRRLITCWLPNIGSALDGCSPPELNYPEAYIDTLMAMPTPGCLRLYM